MRWGRPTFWTVFLLAAVAAGLLQIRLLADLNKNGGNMGDEAEMLCSMLRVQRGETLYRDYRQPPHVLALYMPAFYLVPGTLSRWLSATDDQTIFITRVYVYLAWIGVAVCLVALLRQAGGTWDTAAMAGLLWLAGAISIHSAHAARPDALLILFSLAALWAYRRGWLVTAAILAVGAAFHKQNGGLVWLALLAAELAGRRWQNVGKLGGGFIVVGGLGLMAAQFAWGDLFWLNPVQGLARQYSFDRLGVVLWLTLLGGGVVWLTGFWGAATAPAAWRWYFGFALAWAVISSGGTGAGDNYFLEPYALACLLTAFAVSTGRGRNIVLGGLLVFLTAVTTIRATTAADWWRRLTMRAQVRAQEAAAWTDLLNRIGVPDQAVLIEDPALALRRDREPVLLNASGLLTLQRAGRFDDSHIRQGIERGKWPVIVLTAPMESPGGYRHFAAEWLGAMRGRYVLQEQVGLYHIYRRE
ncbi:MAG: hypothetical protein PCFJNLEI_02311 [Verrucomicrobiae bacterium]|nr:hypothetical protein [Verrucomicrobiae bacterium]